MSVASQIRQPTEPMAAVRSGTIPQDVGWLIRPSELTRPTGSQVRHPEKTTTSPINAGKPWKIEKRVSEKRRRRVSTGAIPGCSRQCIGLASIHIMDDRAWFKKGVRYRCAKHPTNLRSVPGRSGNGT